MQSINDLSSYEINLADRWEPLKSLIIGPGALLEKTEFFQQWRKNKIKD